MTLPGLLADECCPYSLVQALRRRGFDVRYVAEEDSGISDQEVLAAADRDGRVLITTDKDFGALVVRMQIAVPGLILMRVPAAHLRTTADRTSDRLAAIGDEILGHVTTVNAKTMRRRALSKPAP